MKLIPTTKNPKKTANNPTTIHNKVIKKKSLKEKEEITMSSISAVMMSKRMKIQPLE
jgi:hypothetical protein